MKNIAIIIFTLLIAFVFTSCTDISSETSTIKTSIVPNLGDLTQPEAESLIAT